MPIHMQSSATIVPKGTCVTTQWCKLAMNAEVTNAELANEKMARLLMSLPKNEKF